MTKREQVTEALEMCASNVDCREKCPYYSTQRACVEAMCKDVLKLLKEQEPVKPRYEDTFADRLTRCGNCNAIIYRCYEYCPGCGRKVKWDD